MVKLSYYFPVSSDSLSLKRQLLESGVLDITNETMYRMAPEAVDPSILSRGSLSYRRYTRSALLMLRDDILSRKKPKCISVDSHLLKFPFWKLDNNNFTTFDESTTTTAVTTTTTPTSLICEENPLNIKHNSSSTTVNHLRNYKNPRANHYLNHANNCNIMMSSNREDQILYNFDSHEGRLIEKYDMRANKRTTTATSYPKNYLNDHSMQWWDNNYNKSRNFDRTNFQSSYMMPNFVKNKYSNRNDGNCSSSAHDLDESKLHGTSSFGWKANHNDHNSNKDHNINNEEIFQKNSTSNYYGRNNMDQQQQRYGSGRLSLQNKNWNFVGKNSDTNFSNYLKKYSDFPQSIHSKSNTSNSHYNNYNNHHNNHHNNYRYKEDSGSSSVQSCNSEEPEWLNCGPISQNDVIELRGFDDDPASDASSSSENDKIIGDEIACEKPTNQQNIDLKISEEEEEEKKEESITEIMMDNNKDEVKTTNNTKTTLTTDNVNQVQAHSNNNVQSVPQSITSANSAHNDDIQSVCTTSTASSPPPARSTPTKLLNLNTNSNSQNQNNSSSAGVENNKKSYYSLQFNFDNFLDYDTINNILGDNSTSRSKHWFKTQHNTSHHNHNDSKVKHSTSTDKKNFVSQDQFPRNAINVKDLEDQIRKIGYYKYFPYQNNNYNNTNTNNNNQYQGNQNLQNSFQQNQYQHQFSNNNNRNQQSPIKASVNAFTQSAYKHMLAQANSIVKQAQDPEIFRRFLEQINSVNQITALSQQLSNPFLLQQSLLIANNNNNNNINGLGGTQKRIPSTRELEFHTRNIVQNALFRKHLLEQQKTRLQELQQQITIPSNINPNAAEFKPTSVLRKISSENENNFTAATENENLNEMLFGEHNNYNNNLAPHRSKPFNACHNSQPQYQQYFQQLNHHYQQQLLKQKNYNRKPSSSSILNNMSNMKNKNSNISGRSTGEKHIKWENNYLHYMPNNNGQPTGRPILKGSSTNLLSKTPSTQHSSQFKPQQQYEDQQYGFDNFLKSKYNSNPNHNKNTHFGQNSQNCQEQRSKETHQPLYEAKQTNAEVLSQFFSQDEKTSTNFNEDKNVNLDISNSNFNNDHNNTTKFENKSITSTGIIASNLNSNIL